MNTLVLGAAGFLGLNLVDELRAAGVDPLCARRARTNVIPLRSRRARMVNVDLDEPASLIAAMAQVDLVIHAAGHYDRSVATTVGLHLGLGTRGLVGRARTPRAARSARGGPPRTPREGWTSDAVARR